MKPILFLLPVFLSGCAGFSPAGAILNGTNASKIVAKGNVKTGEYVFYAEDLNNSDSFGKASDVAKVKLFTVLGAKGMEEVGDLGSEALDLAQ